MVYNMDALTTTRPLYSDIPVHVHMPEDATVQDVAYIKTHIVETLSTIL